MPLPENMTESLVKSLPSYGLLDLTITKELTARLDIGKPIQWNFLLNKQLKPEKGDASRIRQSNLGTRRCHLR